MAVVANVQGPKRIVGGRTLEGQSGHARVNFGHL